MPPEMPRKPRQDRPFAQQHEEWMAHLRRQVVSRRTVVRGAVGAAAGSLDRVMFSQVAGGVA